MGQENARANDWLHVTLYERLRHRLLSAPVTHPFFCLKRLIFAAKAPMLPRQLCCKVVGG